MPWQPLYQHPLFVLEGQPFDGTKSNYPIVRIRSPDWVNVVAVDVRGDILLVRQYRFGIEDETLELPGGVIDPGEEPLAAAIRELREETGHGGGRWSSLGFVHPNPATHDNRTWLFLAEGVEEQGALALDPLEVLRVERLPLADAHAFADSGRLTHALGLAGLQRFLLRQTDARRADLP